MHKGLTLGVVLNAIFFAGAISASSVPVEYRAAEYSDRGVRVAQAVALPTIAPSSLRRLTFYSDKAMLALFDLVNEDLVAGEGGSISSETTDAFRTAIERLIGAGEKADLDVNQTAVFFGQEVAVRFSGPIPLILQGVDGGINAQNLFQGIANSLASTKERKEVDAAYLSALLDESQSMQVTTEEPEVVPEEVDDNIDPVFAARVVMVDGNRTITVVTGDSLASYATAYYGDAPLYRTIYTANRDVMSNPNLLDVGDAITIPYLQ